MNRITKQIAFFFAFTLMAGCAGEVSTIPADDRIAPLLDGMGDHHMPISTTDSMAQRYFDQGLVLYYGFNHAEAVLSTVIDASKGEQGLDNITLNRPMRRFAKAQHQAGDEKGAKKTLDDMVKVFEKKKLKPTVLSIIKQQAKETRDALK
jgi:hypothetical protein